MNARHDDGLDRLCRLMRLAISLEQACLDMLSETIARDADPAAPEVREWVDRIHLQWNDILKQQALANAAGIDLQVPAAGTRQSVCVREVGARHGGSQLAQRGSL